MTTLALFNFWLPWLMAGCMMIFAYGVAYYVHARTLERHGQRRLQSYGEAVVKRKHRFPIYSKLASWFEQTRFNQEVKHLLEDADLNWKLHTVLLVYICLFAFILIVIITIFWLKFPLNILLSAVGAGSALFYHLKQRQGARERALQAQVPEIALLLSNSMRAGLTLHQALQSINDKLAAPARDVFRKVVQAMELGKPSEDVLHDLLERHPGESMRILLTTLLIQRETGGDLIKTLSNTSTIVFKRQRVVEEVYMVTTETRRNSTIMMILPIGVLGMINLMTGGMVSQLINDTLWGFFFFVVIYALPQICAQVLIRKICNIQV